MLGIGFRLPAGSGGELSTIDESTNEKLNPVNYHFLALAERAPPINVKVYQQAALGHPAKARHGRASLSARLDGRQDLYYRHTSQ
jgi:hypothetical protein